MLQYNNICKIREISQITTYILNACLVLDNVFQSLKIVEI
jgi:hypothetical protein